MTQASRPQAEHADNFPAPSDPGPYSADEWTQIYSILFTPGSVTTQGPIVRYLNELEPTDNGSTEVYVDTGAGLVNGHLLISSEQETWTVPAGPAGGRQDRVVMVENNSNAEVTQSTAGRPLLFPNDLSEYTGTPGVPAYSARLAILRGDDLNNLPALDQTNTLYMVELYRYSINNVPTISSQVDYRDFCYFGSTIGTRNLWVPALVGSGPTALQYNNQGPGVPCADAATTTVGGFFSVPEDYASAMVAQVVLSSPVANAGNLRGTNTANGRANGELYNTHVSTITATVAAPTADRTAVGWDLTITGIDTDDYVGLAFARLGADPLDTSTAVVTVHGWKVSYAADS